MHARSRCCQTSAPKPLWFSPTGPPPFRGSQTALVNAGMSLTSGPYMDRDELLSALGSQWGSSSGLGRPVQGWVSCDTATKRVAYVSICLDPASLEPVGERGSGCIARPLSIGSALLCLPSGLSGAINTAARQPSACQASGGILCTLLSRMGPSYPCPACTHVPCPADCPWDVNSSAEGGAECAGPLLMSPGVVPPAACTQYFPKLIPGAVPTTTPVRCWLSHGGIT